MLLTARGARHLPDIEDELEYNRIMAEARSRFEVPDQPAMPVIYLIHSMAQGDLVRRPCLLGLIKIE